MPINGSGKRLTSVAPQFATGRAPTRPMQDAPANPACRPARLVPIHIPDGASLIDPDSGGPGAHPHPHPHPPEYAGHLAGVLLPSARIGSRAAELASLIHEDYAGRRPHLVCVLKGASIFFHEMLRRLQDRSQGYTFDFLRASSYEGTETTGTVRVSEDFDYGGLEGRDVIVVEDIIDTGVTLSRLLPVLRERGGCRSVEVCTLLEKRIDGERGARAAEAGGGGGHAPVVARYCGFSIPNRFVIGYGLDYNELYRDLRDIWIISQAGIEFDHKTLAV